MEEKSAAFVQILIPGRDAAHGLQFGRWSFRSQADRSAAAMPQVPPLNLLSGARVRLNALEYTAANRFQLVSLVIDVPVIGAIKKSVEPEDLSSRSRQALRRSRRQGRPCLPR
jgi:hypothetical protein